MKVVIIDDAIFIRNLLVEFFKSINFEIAGLGHDGNDAVKLYKKHRPDLLIMDLQMPQKDGYEALIEIIKIDADARVIMCSAIKDSTRITQVLQAGAKAYICKPLQMNDSEYVTRLQDDISEALEKD